MFKLQPRSSLTLAAQVLLATLLLPAIASAQQVETTAAVEEDEDYSDRLDPRVAKALGDLKLGYEVDKKGDAKVILSFTDDGGRTQLVVVQSGTYQYRNNEFRDVFSAGLKADEEKGLDLPLARRLLEESSRSKLAFWGVEDAVVWSIARIPADAPADALKEAIDFVAVTADDLEKERVGTDEF